MTKKPVKTPVVAVLNLKGGVGKTTISAHMFEYIALSHVANTLLIDLDPQFNLSQQLLTRETYDGLYSQGKTVYAAMEPLPDLGLLKVKTTTAPPPSAADVAVKLWHFTKSVEKGLSLLPGDFRTVKYSLQPESPQIRKVRSRFLDFVNGASGENDIIVIDCNPSSSFLTLCALEACTHILAPVRLDKYSILGLELLWRFVDNLPINPKPRISVLINGPKRTAPITDIESELRTHSSFGPATLAAVLYETNYLRAIPDYTGFASDRRGPYSEVVKTELREVALEYAQVLGMKK